MISIIGCNPFCGLVESLPGGLPPLLQCVLFGGTLSLREKLQQMLSS